ncbi:DMT family transporter [Roseibacillus ishigakijimensis]|uniref:EamA family transporter n=1 Tax=Roseibacillus ishigakijimensis TaxID=454146 RepID=A0A934RP74_9BACT|nr:DMT family transporter [Roseibacillus ishigakijimensis]MBK1835447.1 EamA family transporter [Roseibacillus ishigakijimensis]
MTWLFLTLLSAILLGCYDFLKKSALRDNAVLPVIFGGIAAGALAWIPFILWSALAPASLPHPALHVTALSGLEHLLLLAKSALVVASWIFGYLGLKALPLSIATPIRATSPLWTILFAILLFGESPSLRQWTGVAIILTSFFFFSVVGKREGIHFHRSKPVYLIIAATILGSCSALLDKYLLQNIALTATEVQAWFSLYSAPVMFPALLWWRGRADRNPFEFRWTIPAIGLTLLAADWFYFTAIAQPEALISLISPVRRSAVVVSFALGILLLGEQFRFSKLLAVLGILAGVFLLA